MKKIVLLLLVLIMTLTASPSFASVQLTNGSDVYVMNGYSIDVKGVVPYLKDKQIMVNSELIAKLFMFPTGNVKWDEDKQQLKIYKQFKEITLTIGSTTAIVDGNTVALDTAPEIKFGQVMVPLRFIAEIFGDNVSWDSQLKQMNIIYDYEKVYVLR